MSDNAEHDIRKESKVMAGSSVDGGLRGKFYKLNVFAAEFVPRSDRLSAMTVVVDADPQLQQSTADAPDPQMTFDLLSKDRENGSAENYSDQYVDARMDGDGRPKRAHKKPEKTRLNMVIVGHKGAGKSEIRNHITALTGVVDKGTSNSSKKEAEKIKTNSEVSDNNEKEQENIKAVEVGKSYFETERKYISILDSPGDTNFVPNVFGGTALADIAVLVISACLEEFHFDNQIKTREHAMLAKISGAKFMVVLINKMDDPTVLWSKSIFEECRNNILPYLKSLGFSKDVNLTFMPVSGQIGLGLLDRVKETICPWYRDVAFIPFINNLLLMDYRYSGAFTMPIVGKFNDMGTVVMGKVVSGKARKAQTLVLMPNKTQVIVDQLWSNDEVVASVGPGENIKVKLKGVEVENVSLGLVLCDPMSPISTCHLFDGQVVILEHNSSIAAGYSAILCVHEFAKVVEVKALICLVDQKTGMQSNTRPKTVTQGQIAIMRLECFGVVCLEKFEIFPKMGRFTLKNEGKTVAVGKVMQIIE